jgi:hypothetical protein
MTWIAPIVEPAGESRPRLVEAGKARVPKPAAGAPSMAERSGAKFFVELSEGDVGLLDEDGNCGVLSSFAAGDFGDS